jgi:hypothetical protein
MKPKKYNIEFNFNGITIKKRAENIKKAILSISPEQLYTEMFIQIAPVGSKDFLGRKLPLFKAKRLFFDEDFLDVFIINLNLN